MKKTKKPIFKFIVVAVLFFITACDNNTEIEDDTNNLAEVDLIIDQQKFLKADADRKKGDGDNSDSFEIQNVKRDGDILKVQVSYSGGCEKHIFDVLYEGTVLLSHPCQIKIILKHDANNDSCEAQLTEILEIDLVKLIGDNESKDACVYNVFSILNDSDKADGIIISEN